MAKLKKDNKKDDKNQTLQRIVLITAVLNLIKSVIDIITKLID